jgi:hypothetical protein
VLTLCPDDPLLTLLRGAFPEAHVLSRPQRRLRPLITLAARRARLFAPGEVRVLGSLPPLLSIPAALPAPRSDPSPSFTGQRTRTVDADVGVRLLTGLLEGLGVDPTLFTGAFEGAEGLSFSFSEVRHHHVDVNALSQALRGVNLDVRSPSLRPVLDGALDLYLVDATFTSSAFTVQVNGGLEAGVAISAPTASTLLQAGAAVRYLSEDKRSLSFSGSAPLTYAFTALRVELGAGGRVRGFHGGEQQLTFTAPVEPEHALLWPTDQAHAFMEPPDDPQPQTSEG